MGEVTLRAGRKVDPPGGEPFLLPLLGAPDLRSSDHVIVDLRAMALVDPYGLALLWLLLRHVSVSGATCEVAAPRDDGTANYLSASRLFDVLPCDVPCHPALPSTGFRRTTIGNNVLAVTSIRADDDIRAVRDDCRSILTRQLQCGKDYANAFGGTLSELCQNILDHAQDPCGGIVAAQKYRRRQDGVDFVVLAVADAGIGIRASLGQRYRGHFGSDGEAIQSAFEASYTSQPGNGGLGLPRVLKACQRYRGRVDVRSGDAWAQRHASRAQWQVTEGLALPGTLVSVSLYAIR